MKIVRFETLMANAGLRNYLFIRLHTDNGLTGIGEASLEWQEKTVQTLAHEWLEDRVVGCDPFDIERLVDELIRDQYQGGATALTAISAVEIALWDIVGKACGQPVYKLLGGRYHRRIPAYANGWYGGAHTPAEYAERAREAIGRGYRGLKFDPFGVAWKSLTEDEADEALAIVAAVRETVGERVRLYVEFHGRLAAGDATRFIRALEPYHVAWCEEPVAPEAVELLAEVRRDAHCPIAAGERLYMLADFHRMFQLRAVDVVQMDVSHCGGLLMSKKIAALASAYDIRVSPHVSIGPVALAAALHFDVSTPNFQVQENFSDFDVPWRSALVRGWNPVQDGAFTFPNSDAPGLGLELDDNAIADHPYIQNPFPSLWDADWITDFKQDERE
ncbi:MAG: mandelate racemase/muconate lactonizing enzyme family protein [Anaerolineae bacterium]|nr:mandelate racemase/muconate lactonizing enzyme family protein [Anaerolineae bacterium]